MDYQAVAISNDLNDTDTVSAFEIAKGNTKPLEPRQSIYPLTDDPRNAHDEPIAKRKLNLSLRFHATSSPRLKVGDMVQVYLKRVLEKRGRWSSPRVVLSIDPSAGSISVPGSANNQITVAFEEFRLAIVEGK